MIGSIIGAGASVLGTALTNQANEDAHSIAFQRQKELQNAQNVYNSPIKQMERLREAGLNPNLVYAVGNSVMPAATATSVSSPQYRNAFSEVGLSDIFQGAKLSDDIRLLRVQGDKVSAETNLSKELAKTEETKQDLNKLMQGKTVEEVNSERIRQTLMEQERTLNETRITIDLERLNIDKDLKDSLINLRNFQISSISNDIAISNVRVGLERILTSASAAEKYASAGHLKEQGRYTAEQANYLSSVAQYRLAKESIESKLASLEASLKSIDIQKNQKEYEVMQRMYSDYRLALQDIVATLDAVNAGISTANNAIDLGYNLVPAGNLIKGGIKALSGGTPAKQAWKPTLNPYDMGSLYNLKKEDRRPPRHSTRF